MANAQGVLNSVTPSFRAIVELQDRHIIKAYRYGNGERYQWPNEDVARRSIIYPMTEPEYRRKA